MCGAEGIDVWCSTHVLRGILWLAAESNELLADASSLHYFPGHDVPTRALKSETTPQGVKFPTQGGLTSLWASGTRRENFGATLNQGRGRLPIIGKKGWGAWKKHPNPIKHKKLPEPKVNALPGEPRGEFFPKVSRPTIFKR